MKFYVLLILCLIQGLTEFLPVSSSGHLLLLENLFGIEDNLLLLNLFLHLSTLLAVIIYYRKIIFGLLKKPFQPLTYKLVLSTAITLVFAVIYEIFDLGAYLDAFYCYYFLVTALLLFVTFLYQKKSISLKVGEISYKDSIIVGAVQGIAVLPGISRSGSTISSLLLLGNDESESAKYSFLLSIPIIVGGFLFEILKIDSWETVFNQINPWYIVFAFFFTFIVAFLSLKLTVKLLKGHKFIYFSIYLFLLGLSVIFFL